MPVKRSATVMRLSDLSFWECFHFRAGCWRPGHPATRWKTWSEYFATYELVRAELLAEPRHWQPFAEHARDCFLAGTDPTEARVAYDEEINASMRGGRVIS